MAIALSYPELRAEIAAQLLPAPRGVAAKGLASAEIHDPMLAAMLEDICLSEEAQSSLEVRIMAGLGEDQRERLSGLIVGPLMADADSARAGWPWNLSPRCPAIVVGAKWKVCGGRRRIPAAKMQRRRRRRR